MPTPRDLRPRTTPQQDRSREMVDAIVEAAAQVFERHGYAAGTTNRIAERAGASVGSVYQYFPNKDAILVALTRRHLEEGARRLAPVLAALGHGDVALRDGLERLMAGLVALHAAQPRLHRVLFEEAPRPAALMEELRGLEAGAHGVLVAWLSGRPEVAVPDVDLAARFTVTIGEALVHRLVIHPDGAVDAAAYEREAVRLLELYLTGGGRAGRVSGPRGPARAA